MFLKHLTDPVEIAEAVRKELLKHGVRNDNLPETIVEALKQSMNNVQDHESSVVYLTLNSFTVRVCYADREVLVFRKIL